MEKIQKTCPKIKEDFYPRPLQLKTFKKRSIIHNMKPDECLIMPYKEVAAFIAQVRLMGYKPVTRQIPSNKRWDQRDIQMWVIK